MMHRGLSNGRVQGFTLIEMLVAITVMMLVVPLAVQGVRVGLDTWERLATHAQQRDGLRSARRVLYRQLSQAVPLVTGEGTAAERVLFTGAHDVISFVTRLPWSAGGGLHMARIGRANREQGPVLEMRYWPFDRERPDRPPSGEVESVVLLENVTDFRASYLGTWQGAAGAGWQASWSGQAELPQAVRMEIVRESGEQVDNWDLLIPVRAEVAKLAP